MVDILVLAKNDEIGFDASTSNNMPTSSDPLECTKNT
jgi:hypothetical protein